MSENLISKRAIVFAQAHKKAIAKRYTDVSAYLPETHPISVFMAGSPGAGKTESAEALVKNLSNDHAVLRIDTDLLRGEFSEYTGTNSALFQAATSIIADKIHDFALDQKQSFIFDGTLSNLDRTIDNIKRSLNPKRKREVFIIYVYQDPLQAWNFVTQRAIKDGRHVPKAAFTEQYFASRKNVNYIKELYGDTIKVDIIIKNIDGTNLRYIENAASIDTYIKEQYSKSDLERLIV
jgi:UDP-N-acetylglucosamine kinase